VGGAGVEVEAGFESCAYPAETVKRAAKMKKTFSKNPAIRRIIRVSFVLLKRLKYEIVGMAVP
jgi:hypothetical protein